MQTSCKIKLNATVTLTHDSHGEMNPDFSVESDIRKAV